MLGKTIIFVYFALSMNEKNSFLFYIQIGSFFSKKLIGKNVVDEPRALIEDTLYSYIRIRTCIGREKTDDHDRRCHLHCSRHRYFRRRCCCMIISQTNVLLEYLCNSI